MYSRCHPCLVSTNLDLKWFFLAPTYLHILQSHMRLLLEIHAFQKTTLRCWQLVFALRLVLFVFALGVMLPLTCSHLFLCWCIMISDVNILGPLSVFLKTNLSPNNPKVQVTLIFLANCYGRVPFIFPSHNNSSSEPSLCTVLRLFWCVLSTCALSVVSP